MVFNRFKQKLNKLNEDVEKLSEGKSYWDDTYLVDPKETSNPDVDLPNQFDNTKSNNPQLRPPGVGQGKRKFIDKNRQYDLIKYLGLDDEKVYDEEMNEDMDSDNNLIGPLYHGSDKKFDTFDLSLAGKTDEGFLGKAIYLTSELENAQEYGDNINKFYVKLNNPLIISDPYSFGGVNPDKFKKLLNLSTEATPNDVRNELIKKGYDGVIVNEIEGQDMIEVAVFNPNNIIADNQLNEVEATFPLVNFGNSETMKGQGHMGAEFKGLDVNDEDITLDEDIENMDNKNKIIQALNLLPFKDFVKSKGGNIYAVGGVVRDAMMNKPSSDLDIVVTKVDKDTLVKVLQQYGSADFTGTDFGVIKFNPNEELKAKITALGFDDIIDVALPRTDSAGEGDGHKDIEAMVDPNLPIEDDLYRRDFTINSMALSIDGDIVDPFNGANDLKNGVIKWTNPEAFIDDPLRTVRAIRFSAVYGYELDTNTKQAIIDNRDRLKNLPRERFYMEFKKMEKKGGHQIFSNALNLLNEVGIFEIVFGIPFKGNETEVGYAKNLPEFFWLVSKNSTDKPGVLFIATLKGPINEKKYIDALQLMLLNPEDKVERRMLVSKMSSISPAAIESDLTQMFGFKETIDELKSERYPINLKELAVNGDDMMELGFKGPEIGKTLMGILKLVYADKLPNDREEIILTLNGESTKELNETLNKIKRSR